MKTRLNSNFNPAWAEKTYQIEKIELNQKLLDSKKNYYIIGISGGIDSALSLDLLIKAVGKERIKAYYLPIELNYKLEELEIIRNHFQIEIEMVDLTSLWLETIKIFKLENEDNKNNQKSRIRNLFLYAKAFEENGLVISNLNYDEYYLGYFTKFGDSNGDYYSLINFTKSDIYYLSEKVQLPEKIIKQIPSADLSLDQTDERDLKITYSELDNYLVSEVASETTLNQIRKWRRANQHKQTLNYLLKEGFPYKQN